MTSDETIRTKLEAARTRLLIERPFMGALVMHLPLIASRHCKTIATDARNIFFDAGYIDSLTFAETQFVLAHEALHAGLLHWRRGRHRIRARWDRACDYAVNQLLVDDGMTPPLEALLSVNFRGMSAEEIYPLLDPESDDQTLDEHWFAAGVLAAGARLDAASDVGAANANAIDADHADEDAHRAAHRDGFDELATRGSTATPAALGTAWQQRLASSALEAAESGRLGPNWGRALADLVQPRLPWQALLARFVMSIARDDYSFQRPGRRSDVALLPGRTGGEANLVLALDTSGSIGRADFERFIDELDALKGQVRARVTVLACDASIAPDAPWYFAPWEAIELPETLEGGGGTRFTPVFEWVEMNAVRPDALLYFTDAQGEFPTMPPDYPVLWLVKGGDPVPWGERVQLT